MLNSILVWKQINKNRLETGKGREDTGSNTQKSKNWTKKMNQTSQIKPVLIILHIRDADTLAANCNPTWSASASSFLL